MHRPTKEEIRQETLTKFKKVLDKLIDLGRKPRGLYQNLTYIDPHTLRVSEHKTYSINDLVSVDSKLRQFVLEKDLIETECQSFTLDNDGYIYSMSELNFWLMESAITNHKEWFVVDALYFTLFPDQDD